MLLIADFLNAKLSLKSQLKVSGEKKQLSILIRERKQTFFFK